MQRIARAASLAACMVLAGCAITSGYKSGPHGRPVQYIDGMSAATAYKKAAQLCPSGYEILGEPRQTTPLDYELTVECNAVGYVPPVAASAPPAISAAPSGPLSPAERAAQISAGMSCGTPVAASNGSSLFKATCPSGEIWIDCSSGACTLAK